MLKNNKGFTLIEFVLSFTIAMFIVLGMYSLTVNYREKTQLEETKRDLLEFKNDITKTIYEDIQDRGLKSVDSCTDDLGNVIDKCIKLTFKNDASKRLRIITTEEEETLGNSTFTYDVTSIIYGKELFTVPYPKYVNVVDDYMFLDSYQINVDVSQMYDIDGNGTINTNDFAKYQLCYEGNCGDAIVNLDLNFDGNVDKSDLEVYEAYNEGFYGEYGDYGRIYSIKIRLKHQDIKEETVIKVVATAS